MRLKIPEGQASIAAQGAQVLSWVGPDGRERLYLSPQILHLDRIADDKAFGPAIRGGVPVCFPQFSDRGPLMKHGFARSRIWNPVETPKPVTGTNGPSSVLFRFTDDEATFAHWPHRFDAQLQLEIDPGCLRINLQIANPGDTSISFTMALHTYFRVKDIRQTTLSGLQGVRFEDATKGMRKAVQQEESLQILGEIDRVYLDSPGKVVLHEGSNPSLVIEQEGFIDTVVWNPGPEKAKALADFPDDDWLQMLCVEAAYAAKPLILRPGESWTGSQILTIPGMR